MKLAVFFPGIGYHCDKPLLYYSRKLVQEYGYEKIVTLNYTYDGKNLRGNEEKIQQAFDSLYIQAENSLKELRLTSTKRFYLFRKASEQSLLQHMLRHNGYHAGIFCIHH